MPFQHFYWYTNANSAYLCTRVGHVVERREWMVDESESSLSEEVDGCVTGVQEKK